LGVCCAELFLAGDGGCAGLQGRDFFVGVFRSVGCIGFGIDEVCWRLYRFNHCVAGGWVLDHSGLDQQVGVFGFIFEDEVCFSLGGLRGLRYLLQCWPVRGN